LKTVVITKFLELAVIQMANAETGVNIRNIQVSQMKMHVKELVNNKSWPRDTESQ
jgi:hypothetical protein